MKYITNWYSDYEQHLLKLCCSYWAIIWHLGSWNHVVLTVHQIFVFSSKLYSKSTWQTFCNASKTIAAHHFECATAYWFREMNSQKPATLNYRSCVNDGGIQTTTERCFPLFLNWANFKIWTVQAQWSQSSREMCVCVCTWTLVYAFLHISQRQRIRMNSFDTSDSADFALNEIWPKYVIYPIPLICFFFLALILDWIRVMTFFSATHANILNFNWARSKRVLCWPAM